MKNKIKWILKRVTYIDDMIKEGAKKRKYYINKRYEIIDIGDIELKVIEIINDVVRSEKEIWIKKIFREKKKGEKDFVFFHFTLIRTCRQLYFKGVNCVV